MPPSKSLYRLSSNWQGICRATPATTSDSNISLVGSHTLLGTEWVLVFTVKVPGKVLVGVVRDVVSWEDSEALAVVGNLGLFRMLA